MKIDIIISKTLVNVTFVLNLICYQFLNGLRQPSEQAQSARNFIEIAYKVLKEEEVEEETKVEGRLRKPLKNSFSRYLDQRESTGSPSNELNHTFLIRKVFGRDVRYMAATGQNATNKFFHREMYLRVLCFLYCLLGTGQK